MNKLTKILFLIGAIFLIYGYICRNLNLYFFWDSKSFGWIFIFVAFLSYLFDVSSMRKKRGAKTFWVKIGIGLIPVGSVITTTSTSINGTSESTEANLFITIKGKRKHKDLKVHVEKGLEKVWRVRYIE